MMGGSSHLRDLSLSRYRACSRAALRSAPLAWLIAAGAAQANDIVVSEAWTPPTPKSEAMLCLGWS